MLIREVEQQTGIKDVNIRYYEKEGLIHPKRKANGYREYSQEDVQMIQQIKILRLLDIPVPVIKELLNDKISLQDAISQKLSAIKDEESRIKEIKSSCEAIIQGNIQVSQLSEDILCGTHATWKERLDEMMQEDIDKKFLRNGFLYLIGWAVFWKLTLVVTTWQYLDLSEYALWGIGIFLILYGIGLNIFEELSGKEFFWVYGTNWGGSGLGALGNSYTFCGIGVASLGTNWIGFVILLLVMCILLSIIRGRIMYLKSPRRKKEPPKTAKTMVLVSVILTVLFAVSVAGLRADYLSKNPTTDDGKKPIEKLEGTELKITTANWNEYFDLVESESYDKDENGNITRVYKEAWFALKDEYWNQLNHEAENEVIFTCVIDHDLKKYKITDPKTGEYEILGNAPKGIMQPENQVWQAWWDSDENGVLEDVPLIEKYDGDKDYIYTYKKIEVKAASGTIIMLK